MPAIFTLIRQNGCSYSKILLCVLLACLFLYNPFQAASHDHGSLMVCHPASYRATVASSEVEQFAPPMAGAAALALEPNAAERLISQLAANDSESRSGFDQEVIASPQAGFSSSLWFRPPPSA